MAKDPAFLFYSQDFFTGTATMSFEDKGKYIHILSLMHQQGRMSEETIRFVVGSVSDSLKSKFVVDTTGLWYNERLESEIDKRAKFIESRINNGKLGGRPKALAKPNGKPKEEPTDNLLEDENENSLNKKRRIKKTPTVEQVVEYFKANGYSEAAAKKAHEHYRLADWHDTHGNPVLAWKQKMHTNWFKPEHEEIKPENIPFSKRVPI